MKQRLRPRLGALISLVALLVAFAAVPLMGSGQEATPADESDHVVRGQGIFETACIACHQPGGVGIEGIYPPLDGNPLITLEDPTYVVSVVLNGRGGMPRFAGTYDDEEIAAVVSYVRQAWSNDAPPVGADEVNAVRTDTDATEATPVGQEPVGVMPATPDVGTPEASGTPEA